MLLPALSKAKEKALRAKCMSNIKQLVTSVIIYGNDNKDRMPDVGTGTAYWPWDVPNNVMESMLASGTTRDICYDPAFPQQNRDGLWFYFGYHVTGYAFLFWRTAGLVSTNWNRHIYPEPMDSGTPLGVYPAPPSTDRPIVADVTISLPGQRSTNPNAWGGYKWVNITASDIPGTYNGANWPGHRTSHTAKSLPVGGNLGMMDGHVEWRKMMNMVPRTRPDASTVPTFWW